VRDRGSHIQLQKRMGDEVLKLTVPANRPVKRSILSHDGPAAGRSGNGALGDNGAPTTLRG
jgi:hypothetical protein